MVDKQFVKVAKMKRKETLKTRTKPKLQRRKYSFVTTWDPGFPDIRKALHKFTNVLMEDEECRQVFPKGSFRVAFKKGHMNLKEIIALSRSMFSVTEGPFGKNRSGKEGSCKKCGKCGMSDRGRKRKNINNCMVLQEGTHFRSNVTGEKFRIKQEINCRSKNIIYLVTCGTCGKQGVGRTTAFQSRISNYISHICNHEPTCSTVKHFYETLDHSFQDFRIMRIVQLENPPKTPKALKARLIEFEGYWQVKLQTLEPYGLNSINEFQEQMKNIGTMPLNDPQGSICPEGHLHLDPL